MKVLDINAFVRGLTDHIITNLLDILAQTAYAVEGALDEGYYKMGEALGKVINIILFNDAIV